MLVDGRLIPAATGAAVAKYRHIATNRDKEIEAKQYEDFFKEQLLQLADYDGVFYQKSRARTMNEQERTSVDGCATFFKKSKYF